MAVSLPGAAARTGRKGRPPAGEAKNDRRAAGRMPPADRASSLPSACRRHRPIFGGLRSAWGLAEEEDDRGQHDGDDGKSSQGGPSPVGVFTNKCGLFWVRVGL